MTDQKDEFVWVASATIGRYYGRNVHVKVKHYLITPSSNPDFFITLDENIRKRRVCLFGEKYESYFRLVKKEKTGNTYLIVYVSRRPFIVWRRKLGKVWFTFIREDKLIMSEKIKTTQLRKYLLSLFK